MTSSAPADRFFVISGCSGGGKSTLVAALAARGYATIEEPGRRIVRAEVAGDGQALPWRNLAAFADRAIALAKSDHQAAQTLEGPVFFDRSLIDAIAALEHATGSSAADQVGGFRYNSKVFLAPPWPEIYVSDSERAHDFAQAVTEYARLSAIYPRMGYTVIHLPKLAIAQRVNFILAHIDALNQPG